MAIVGAAVLVAGLYRRYPIPMVIVTLALIVAGVAIAAGIIVVAFGVVAVLRLRLRPPAGTARSRPPVSVEGEGPIR